MANDRSRTDENKHSITQQQWEHVVESAGFEKLSECTLYHTFIDLFIYLFGKESQVYLQSTFHTQRHLKVLYKP